MSNNIKSWTVSDVSNYLKQIGLEKYTDSFIKNDIDGLALLNLTEQNLKELGISSIGHRIKLNRFISSVKDKETQKPNPVQASNIKTENAKSSTDEIHPLKDSVHHKMITQMIESENQEDRPVYLLNQTIECKICHQKIPSTFYDYHEKSCRDIFLKCKAEYQRRGMNLTDDDIIDLLNGKVPIHHVKLEKCKYCGRKFAPSTFSKHEIQCQKRMSNLKNEGKEVNSPQSDFKKKHEDLIRFIQLQRKEKKRQIIYSENSFPVVKNEGTDFF